MAVLCAVAAVAAEGDAWLSFGTAGPDAYADGAPVLDGESYALVWTANETFGGLAADGSPAVAGDRLIVSAPLAKDGRCPETLFQISRKTAEALAEGTYGIVLLDTRVASAGGATNLAPRVGGKPTMLNGWGEAAGRVALNAPGRPLYQSGPTSDDNPTSGGPTSGVDSGDDDDSYGDGRGDLTNRPPAIASVMAAAPAGVAQPRILDIALDGENVRLTVENRGGYVRAQGGPDIAANAVTGPAQAAPSDGGPVVVILPKQGASGFFKAVGN